MHTQGRHAYIHTIRVHTHALAHTCTHTRIHKQGTYADDCLVNRVTQARRSLRVRVCLGGRSSRVVAAVEVGIAVLVVVVAEVLVLLVASS